MDDVIDYPDQVFIGGIDYNMQEDEFVEEVKSWGNIKTVYYRGPTTGWGTATFTSAEERNKFLARKRFVLGNKIVDVKAFQRPKYKQAPSATTATQPSATASSSSQVAAKPVAATPGPPPGMSTITRAPMPGASTAKSSQAASAAIGASTALTGVILRYTSPNFGVIRTNNQGNGILSADVVYLCSNPDHNLACKTSDCPTYTKLTAPKRTKKSLFAALPIGTQISFLSRALEIEGYNFQATVAWPQLSRKPSGATPNAFPSNSILDEQLRQFLSAEDSRADDNDKDKNVSKDTPRKTAAAPAWSTTSAGTPSKLLNDDDLLDDGDLLDELDLDIALDHLNGISSFLQILGVRTEGLSLTPLIDKLMAIKHEGEAVDEIMDFFYKNGVPIDESRKRNLVANYRTLLHSLRIYPEPSASSSTTATPPPSSDLDEVALTERFCQFLIRETTAEYFRYVTNKKTIEKECRTVVDIWRSKGFSLSRLAAEFRESQRTGSQEFLENRWRREIELPITDENLQCLIEPVKIHELTMIFFQREQMHLNGPSSITRSSSGASISSRGSYAAPVIAPTIPRKSLTPPAAPPSNGDAYSNPRRLSTSFLSEIHKLTVPPPPDSLKQLGSHFKPAIMLEGDTADEISNLLENDTDYKSFSVFATWLRSNYSFCSSSASVTVDNQLMFVFNIIKYWSNSHKSINDIREIFRKYISEPKILFANWAHSIKSQSDLMVSSDTVLKATFSFCLDSLPTKHKSIDSSELTSLFHNVTFVEPTLADVDSGTPASSSAFFNLRGFVIHNFNEDYGLVQTPVGKVLFERNIAFVHQDSNWKRCKSRDLMFPVMTPVKLHVRVARLKLQRRNQTDISLLYATKVWSWTETPSAEPYAGTTLLGREMYWTQAIKEFENLVKVNPNLLYNSSDRTKFNEDYRQTFSYVLKSLNSDSLDSGVGQLLSDENMGYDPFKHFLASQVPDYKENEKGYLASIRSFSRSSKFSNFHDLRKRYMLHTILNTIESFEEMLETQMIFSKQNELSNVAQCDIVPNLIVFFSSRDPITDAQLQEQKKIISRNIKGSAAHLEEVLCLIGNLLEQKAVPTLLPSLPNSVGAASTNGSSAAATLVVGGAKNKVLNNNIEGDKSTVTLSQTEWASILKRLENLEMWKEKKLAEDMIVQKNIRDYFAAMQEEINALSVELRAVKETAAAPHNVTMSPPSHHIAAAKNGPTTSARNIYVKIAITGSNEIHEFPTDDNGNLQVESVVAVYQGTTALKYLSDTGTHRICRKIGDIFEQPENGWEDKVYYANISGATQPSFPPRPSNAGLYQAQPPMPNYGGLTSGGLSYNGLPGNLLGRQNMQTSSGYYPFFSNNM